MGATETILIPPYGHTLAGTLREIAANGIASRIELKPQSPFAGDPEFDSSDLSAWTRTNSANADTFDANTTRKGRLYIEGKGSSGGSGPIWAHQTISGDFDVYCACGWGQLKSDGVYNLQLGIRAESTSRSDDYVLLRVTWAPFAGVAQFDLLSVNDGASTSVGAGTNWFDANQQTAGGFVWIRLKRSGNQFTGYYSHDGKNWTTMGGAGVARADFSSDQKLGWGFSYHENQNTEAITCDFLRTWPPYVTTSPVSTVVLDSGAAGTVWTPSTFAALENPPLDPFGIQGTIGTGTLKYRLAASDTNPPTLSGSALTEAQVQALSALTGRYLHVEVTYISANGYELASFAGAKIQRTIQTPPRVHPSMTGGMRG